jgi:hypothetical protein
LVKKHLKNNKKLAFFFIFFYFFWYFITVFSPKKPKKTVKKPKKTVKNNKQVFMSRVLSYKARTPQIRIKDSTSQQRRAATWRHNPPRTLAAQPAHGGTTTHSGAPWTQR